MPRKKERKSSQKDRPKSRRTNLSGDALERRDQLIHEYHEFVETVVIRLSRAMRLPSALKDEFVSAGYFGLIEAASRFDSSRGPDFRSYAFLRIRGAIIDYIRSSCDPSGQAHRTLQALEAAQELRELFVARRAHAESSGDKAEAGRLYLERSALAFALAQISDRRADELRHDLLNPEQILQRKRQSEKIRLIVATLPEKERTIIEQYYFHDRKFVDVAAQFAGLSKSWVSRLHDRALEILRDKLSETAAEMAAG
jgi:RNA polymerase sigma factor for flagellar operon FliA